VLGESTGWVAQMLRGSPFHLVQTQPNTSKPIRAKPNAICELSTHTFGLRNQVVSIIALMARWWDIT